MTASHAVNRTQSHFSIDTHDLERSRAFYRALFAAEPVLEKPDYVRFWPSEPGLVLGLNRRAGAARDTGRLRHMGLLFPDAAGLAAARRRLSEAGFGTHGAEHTECCYAELDQFWATDPSGVVWELFLAHQEVVEPTSGAPEPSPCCGPSCCESDA